MGVRGGLRVNAFRQLHLKIKSNLPSPFCSGAFAERDELCQCAPGEGKGADEAHRVAWEQAGMVQETDFRKGHIPKNFKFAFRKFPFRVCDVTW
jgi:hypothetical protein